MAPGVDVASGTEEEVGGAVGGGVDDIELSAFGAAELVALLVDTL